MRFDTNTQVFRPEGNNVQVGSLAESEAGRLAAFESLLEGSVTWDPGSLADNAGETSPTITVTGAALGDYVIASFSLDVQEMILKGYVSAANTVTCRLENLSGGVVDLGSGTLRVLVFKRG